MVPPRVPTAAPSERIAPCTEAARAPRLPPMDREPRQGWAGTQEASENRPWMHNRIIGKPKAPTQVDPPTDRPEQSG